MLQLQRDPHTYRFTMLRTAAPLLAYLLDLSQEALLLCRAYAPQTFGLGLLCRERARVPSHSPSPRTLLACTS